MGMWLKVIYFLFLLYTTFIWWIPIIQWERNISISSTGISIEVATFESLPPSYIVNKNEVFKYYILECTNDE